MTVLARALQVIVRGYQLAVSPLLGPRCRFMPRCSDYAIAAIGSHGPARGVWLTARRLARCHPFCDGGYDPVPACDCTSSLRISDLSAP